MTYRPSSNELMAYAPATEMIARSKAFYRGYSALNPHAPTSWSRPAAYQQLQGLGSFFSNMRMIDPVRTRPQFVENLSSNNYVTPAKGPWQNTALDAIWRRPTHGHFGPPRYSRLSADPWAFAPTVAGPHYSCAAGQHADTNNNGDVICRDSGGNIYEPTAASTSPNYVASSSLVPTSTSTPSAIPWIPIGLGAAALFGLTLFMKGK